MTIDILSEAETWSDDRVLVGGDERRAEGEIEPAQMILAKHSTNHISDLTPFRPHRAAAEFRKVFGTDHYELREKSATSAMTANIKMVDRSFDVWFIKKDKNHRFRRQLISRNFLSYPVQNMQPT